MKEIKPQKLRDAEVIVPGSKSYTHRILIAAGLSDGICTIKNPLKSEDTLLTMEALKRFGINIDEENNGFFVHGKKGRLAPPKETIFLGNSGTSMRLLTAVASLGDGLYTLTGTERMQERPIQDLLDGLKQIGVFARSVRENGCPPVVIPGGNLKGGPVKLNCKISSQFLSALLLIAPYAREGLDITVVEGPVSRPYVDMTVAVMEKLGVSVLREGYKKFTVRGSQTYRAGSYTVEPDCSQAGYFWAAAAITGNSVKVKGILSDSRQGDIRFVDLLQKMGCRISRESDGIKITGGPLRSVEADMADMPDLVPTLSMVAAFAKGTTVITNVAHLKAKESDRLTAVANELSKMGIDAVCTGSGLQIHGGRPHGAAIETYGDHRIAMSFAIAGLVVPGVVIKDEQVVGKSFPTFWDVFEKLYG
ncbi:3-phosphoshikimate 1-carboxyvinyltransferase [Thermodesulfobacteriota bacterium]